MSGIKDKFIEEAKLQKTLNTEKVRQIYIEASTGESFWPHEIKVLCESHERLRMDLEAAMKTIKEVNDMMAQVTSMGSVS